MGGDPGDRVDKHSSADQSCAAAPAASRGNTAVYRQRSLARRTDDAPCHDPVGAGRTHGAAYRDSISTKARMHVRSCPVGGPTWNDPSRKMLGSPRRWKYLPWISRCTLPNEQPI